MTRLERLASLREIERLVARIDISLGDRRDNECKISALEKLAGLIDLEMVAP